MNNKQKLIFRKLAELFSQYDLDDVKAALAAFRDDDLLEEVVESASRVTRATKRSSRKPTNRKQQPQQRLAEIEREVIDTGSEQQAYALRVAKKLLDTQAFSGAPLIRGIFEDLSIDVGKSVSNRSQLVIVLYSSLKNDGVSRIAEVEKKLDEYSSQTSSLSDWSRLINRKDDSAS